MLRLLADENMLAEAVEELRRRGHDVRWVRSDCPGISDEQVLALASAESRLLLTFDKDFGELVRRKGRSGRPGVILFRSGFSSPSVAAATIVRELESRSDWAGCFWVVQPNRVRQFKLRLAEPKEDWSGQDGK